MREFGGVSDLEDTRVWRVGVFSGPLVASCRWAADARFGAPWFTRGALFEIVEMGVVTWVGRLSEPVYGADGWELHAVGFGADLPFAEPVIEGDQIVTPDEIAGREAAPFYVNAAGAVASPPNVPRLWMVRPGSATLDTDDAHYVSGVRVFYVSSIDGATGEPNGWALTVPSVATGTLDEVLEAKFGAKRVTIDATNLGLLTAGAAEDIGAERFAQGGRRLGWSGAVELNVGALMSESGALADPLSVRDGDTLRIPGYTDSRSAALYQSTVEVTVGEVTRFHGERRAVVKPVGASDRDLTSIFASIPKPESEQPVVTL